MIVVWKVIQYKIRSCSMASMMYISQCHNIVTTSMKKLFDYIMCKFRDYSDYCLKYANNSRGA